MEGDLSPETHMRSSMHSIEKAKLLIFNWLQDSERAHSNLTSLYNTKCTTCSYQYPYLDETLRFLLPESLWQWSTVIICSPWGPNTTGGRTLSSSAFSSARKGLKATVICRFDPLDFILKEPGSK